MALKTRLMTGSASLMIALAIGYVMQSGGETQQAGLQAPDVEVAEISPQVSMNRLQLNDITLTMAENAPDLGPAQPETDAPVLLAAASTTQMDTPVLDEAPMLEQPVLACTPEMTATEAPGAMARVALYADCLPGRRVTFHHNGMMFTEKLSDKGALEIDLPVLSELAVIIADLGDGEGAVTSVSVPSLAGYNRAVLQWQGAHGPELHAKEFGAGYGEVGHVWAESPENGLGVFTQLGDPDLPHALQAEVYSFPATAAERAGDVEISVDVAVTGANCGQDLQAETLQFGPDLPLDVHELVVSMPQCDAIGDFVMLKNLLQDLKIAAK